MEYRFQDWQKNSDIYALAIKERFYFAYIREDRELISFTDKEVIELFGSSSVKSYLDRSFIEKTFRDNEFIGRIYFCKF